MQNINILDLIEGTLMGLLAIYFLLGLFSNALWLQIDKKGRDGRGWAPRLVRAYFVLAFGGLAVRRFFEAFHNDSDNFDYAIDAILLGGFALFFLMDRKAKPNDDPTA
ncbi:MAG TPA: hypothetical protein VGO57_13805 [Verrucomicrobiae bacterium]|jgi:hypothetical protein